MTTTQELSRIESVDIREIWQDEASNFTPWLANHISTLGEALGLEIELQSTEAPVGGYSLDILAREVGRDRQVIIENQLGTTDHSHLGQLLTYAGGYDANIVIWVARNFRDEHREALDLLNRHTDEEIEFFGIAVEVWRIDGSRPAPHFRVVSAPNDWRKQSVTSRRADGTAGLSERNQRYRAFFQELIDRLREEHRFTNATKGQPQSWYTFSAGLGRVGFNASFAAGARYRVEVYIDRDKDWNEQLFDKLFASKEDIESELGEELFWERLDNRKACRISAVRQGSIDDGPDTLAEIRDWMIERLLAFKRVFGPRLAELA